VKTIKICGVGSVLMGDDAVGPYVAHWIEEHYEFPPPRPAGVQVLIEDLGTPGLDLIAHCSGIDVLILIDAVSGDQPPGTITVYDEREIRSMQPSLRLDAHAPCITESLAIAELAGQAPRYPYLLGVTAGPTELGEPLSDAVRRAVPQVAMLALQIAATHGAIFRRRMEPAGKAVWWERTPVASA